MGLQLRIILMRSITIFLVVLMQGCASLGEPEELTPQEQIQVDNQIGGDLEKRLDPQFRFVKSSRLDRSLSRVALRLAKKSPALKQSRVRVRMIRTIENRWKNYGFPGINVYLCVNVLKKLEYENEVAAAIAFELGHILGRSLLSQLEKENNSVPKELEISGEESFFEFPMESHLVAIKHAVKLLYDAGYDPRGLISLWKLNETHLKRSPFNIIMLQEFTPKTHQTIAKLAPLRNPTVQTSEFIQVRKELQKL